MIKKLTIMSNNATYCKIVHTDKIVRQDLFNRPIYEAQMQLERLEDATNAAQMNEILKIVTSKYQEPILIIYADGSKLLALQDHNNIWIQFETGKPNNIIILDEWFLLDQINMNFLYTFIFDHPELITNDDEKLMYNEMTEDEKNNHLNEKKLICDRFLERYNPSINTFDADYIFEYCVDYQGHNCILEPKPYIKYVNRQNCVVNGP